jgi:DNA-binding MarR family transcriptional regulator
MPQCQNCGKSDNLSQCAGCGKSHYCSADCQKQDWAFHKERCVGKNPKERQSTIFDYKEAPYEPMPRKAQTTPKPTPSTKTYTKGITVDVIETLTKMADLRNNEYAKATQEVKSMVFMALVTRIKDPELRDRIIVRLNKGEQKIRKIIAESKIHDFSKEKTITKHILKTLRMMGYADELLVENKGKTEQFNQLYQEIMQKELFDTASLSSRNVIHDANDYDVADEDATKEEKTRVSVRNTTRYIAEEQYPILEDTGEARYAIINGKIKEVSIDYINAIHKEKRETLVESSSTPYSELLKKITNPTQFLGPKVRSADTSENLTILQPNIPEGTLAVYVVSDQSKKRSENLQKLRARWSVSHVIEDKFPLHAHLTKKLFGKKIAPYVTGLIWTVFMIYFFSMFSGVGAVEIPVDYTPPIVRDALVKKVGLYDSHIKESDVSLKEQFGTIKEIIVAYQGIEKFYTELEEGWNNASNIADAWSVFSGNSLLGDQSIAKLMYNTEGYKLSLDALLTTSIQREIALQKKISKFAGDAAATKFVMERYIQDITNTQKQNVTSALVALSNQTSLATGEQYYVIRNIVSEITTPNSTDVQWKQLENRLLSALASVESERARIEGLLFSDKHQRLTRFDSLLKKYELSKNHKEAVEMIKGASNEIQSLVRNIPTYQQYKFEQYVEQVDPNFFKDLMSIDDDSGRTKLIRRYSTHFKNFCNLPQFHFLLRYGNPVKSAAVRKAKQWINDLASADNISDAIASSVDQYRQFSQVFNQTHALVLEGAVGVDSDTNQPDNTTQSNDTASQTTEPSRSYWQIPLEMASNAYWAYYYACARSWDYGVSTIGETPMIALSVGAELVDIFFTPDEFIVGGSDLVRYTQNWGTKKLIMGWSLSTLQMITQAHNRLLIVPATHAIANDLLLSKMKAITVGSMSQTIFDTVTSPWVMLPGTAAMGLKAATNYVPFIRDSSILAGILNFAASSINWDIKQQIAVSVINFISQRSTQEMALISIAGLVIDVINKETRYWPSIERQELSKELQRINLLDYRESNELLQELGKIFEKTLPGSSMAIEDIQNALMLDKEDTRVLNQYKAAFGRSEKIRETEKGEQELISKFIAASSTKTEMTEADIENGIEHLKSVLAVVNAKINPSNQKQLPEQ